MTRIAVVMGLWSVVSGCAWRGDTKFVATFTRLPPGPSGTQTDTWGVDLATKQFTFDYGRPKTLTEAQVSGLEASLDALKPASRESCTEDGDVRVIELEDGQTRYAEQQYACPGNAQGTYLYVESLERVFAQLRDLLQ